MFDGELLRYSKRKFIVFDCETESLNLFSARAWDLAWVVCSENTILEKHQYFLKWPNLNVGKGAAKVTRFDPQVIAEKGVEPKIAIDKFCEYLYNPEYYIVVHNGLNYDTYIINNCRRDIGYDCDYSFIDRLYDSNAIARSIEMSMQSELKRSSLLEFQYRFANSPRSGIKTSLSVLNRKYKFDFSDQELHGAEKDVSLNFLVWRKLIWEIEI